MERDDRPENLAQKYLIFPKSHIFLRTQRQTGTLNRQEVHRKEDFKYRGDWLGNLVEEPGSYNSISVSQTKKGWKRSRATAITTSVVFIGSILAALSLGANNLLSSFSIFEGKDGVLSTLDHLAANWMLPTGGFLITLFVGWKLGKKFCMEELGLDKPNIFFMIWLWIVRIVAPAAVLILLINVIMGKDFS